MIPRSMLALNDDKTVYHLGLHPDQLADIVILVGDPDRVTRVSRHFDAIHHQVQRREFVTHTGEISGQRISVVSTGIGTSNIDIVLSELDALKNIDLGSQAVKPQTTALTLMRLGTCGAMQEDIAADAVVISQFALGFDAALNFYQRQMTSDEANLFALAQNAFVEHPVSAAMYAASADTALLDRLKGVGKAGITLTCSGFYGPQNRTLRLPLIEQDLFLLANQLQYANLPVTNLEMETAMIYGLGGLMGHRCCSMSSVVFNRVTQEKSPDALAAVDRMIEQALTALLR